MKKGTMILGIGLLSLILSLFIFSKIDISASLINLAQIESQNHIIKSQGSTSKTEQCETGEGSVDCQRLTLNTNKDTAVANGSDSITVTAGDFFIYDSPEESYDDGASPNNPIPQCATIEEVTYKSKIKIAVTGSNNTYNSSEQYINCSTGYVSTTLKSTKAETKTVKYQFPAKGGGYFDVISLNVTFTSPPTSENDDKPATHEITQESDETKKDTNEEKNDTEEKGKTLSEKPTINLYKISNGNFIPIKEGEIVEFAKNQNITFSGQTIPNGLVTLYFYSDPFVDETQANKNGEWIYTLEKDIGIGSHALKITITDPETKKVSDESDPLAFTIKDEIFEKDTEENNTNNRIYTYLLLGLMLVGIGIGIFLYYKNKKGTL